MQYRPYFRPVAYDSALWKTSLLEIAKFNHSSGIDFEMVASDAGEFKRVVENFVFCNGTVRGLLTRLKSQWDVKLGRAGNAKNEPISVLYTGGIEEVAKLLEETLPLTRIDEGATTLRAPPGLGADYGNDQEENFARACFTASDTVLEAEGTDDAPEDPASLDEWYAVLKERGYSDAAIAFAVSRNKLKEQLAEVLNEAESGNLIKPDIPRVSATSMFGPPLDRKEKKSTNQVTALLWAMKIYHEVAGKKDREGLRAVLDTYWFLFMGFLFPKAEVYERSKLLTKTRNIFSSSYVLVELVSLIMTKAFETEMSMRNCPGSLSMYKMTLFKGGINFFLQRGITQCKSEDGPFYYSVYADNLYVFERCGSGDDAKVKLWSLDQIRGEANAEPDRALAVMYYVLSRAWVTRAGLPNFNEVWANIALFIVPAAIGNSLSVLGNFFLPVPGQGSGNALTFYINHVNTTIYLDYLKHYLKKDGGPMSEELIDRVTRKCGVSMSVQKVIPDLEGALIDLIGRTPDVGPLQTQGGDQIVGTPTLDLDILGQGVAWSTKLEIFVPVLDRERLFKAMAYPKTLDKLLEQMNDFDFEAPESATSEELDEGKAKRLARYISLYLMGGWTRPAFGAALQLFIRNLRRTLMSAGADIGDDALDSLRRLMQEGSDYADFSDLFPQFLTEKITLNEFLERVNGNVTPEAAPAVSRSTLNPAAVDQIPADLNGVARLKRFLDTQEEFFGVPTAVLWDRMHAMGYHSAEAVKRYRDISEEIDGIKELTKHEWQDAASYKRKLARLAKALSNAEFKAVTVLDSAISTMRKDAAPLFSVLQVPPSLSGPSGLASGFNVPGAHNPRVLEAEKARLARAERMKDITKRKAEEMLAATAKPQGPRKRGKRDRRRNVHAENMDEMELDDDFDEEED